MTNIAWRLCLMGMVLAVLSINAASATTYQDLIQEGIKLYRAKEFDQAAQKFQSAANSSQPESLDRLTALDNLALPLAELHRDQELWNTKRQAALLRNKIQGSPIPEEFDGNTPDEAKENGLARGVSKALSDVKHPLAVTEARQALLNYYQEKHEYNKANAVYSELVRTFNSLDPKLIVIFKQWAKWCKAEGHMQDAAEHESSAVLIETKLAAIKKQQAEKARLEEKQKEDQQRLTSALAAKQNQERKLARIKNDELWFKTVTSQSVEEPEFPEYGMIGTVNYGSWKRLLEQAKRLDDDISGYETTRRLIASSAGNQQLRAKAAAVDALTSIKDEAGAFFKNAISANKRSDHRSLYTGEPDRSNGAYNGEALYFLQKAYKAYHLCLDKGDERFEQMYKLYCQIRKEQSEEVSASNEAIKAKAAKYK